MRIIYFLGSVKNTVFQTHKFQKLELFPFSDERVVRQPFRWILHKGLLVGRMTTVLLTQPNVTAALTHSPEDRNSSSFMKCWNGVGILDEGKTPEMKYSNPNSTQYSYKIITITVQYVYTLFLSTLRY